MKKNKRVLMRKSAFAKLLHLSKPRITQLVAAGLPVLKNGMIDRDRGQAWYAENILRRAESEQPSPPHPSTVNGSAAASSAAATPLVSARIRKENLQSDLLEIRIEEERRARVSAGEAGAIADELQIVFVEVASGVANAVANYLSLRLEQNGHPNSFLYMSDVGAELYDTIDSIARQKLSRLVQVIRQLERLAKGEAPISREATETISAIEMCDLVGRYVHFARDIIEDLPKQCPPQVAGIVQNAVGLAVHKLQTWRPERGPEKPE